MQVSIDPALFAPIILQVVSETLSAIESNNAKLGDRLAFNEAEAARLLSLETHQLRDERLRGRIGASQIVGRRIRYTRSDLLQYLNRTRFDVRT